MQLADWIVIALYFGLIGFVAWWYGRQQKDTTDYFLAGRNTAIAQRRCWRMAA